MEVISTNNSFKRKIWDYEFLSLEKTQQQAKKKMSFRRLFIYLFINICVLIQAYIGYQIFTFEVLFVYKLTR